jgi:hypothetical protein
MMVEKTKNKKRGEEEKKNPHDLCIWFGLG